MGGRGEGAADAELWPKLLICMDENKCQSVVIVKMAPCTIFIVDLRFLS